jgi:hypothetical protein
MVAQVQVNSGDSQPGLLVPSKAVIRSGTRNLVIVANDSDRFVAYTGSCHGPPRCCPIAHVAANKKIQFVVVSRYTSHHAAVAQLDRVLRFERSGRGFESLQPHQQKMATCSGRPFYLMVCGGRRPVVPIGNRCLCWVCSLGEYTVSGIRAATRTAH